MAGFIVVRQKAQYVVVLWLALSLLSSVSRHNILSYYGWVCRRRSVNTTCDGIMIGFVVVVSQ